MAFKDLILGLTSYPEPTPSPAIQSAVSFASVLGCHLAAVACEIHHEVPGSFLSNALIDIPAMAAREAEKSRQNVAALLTAFEKVAGKAGLSHERIFEKCFVHEVSDVFVEYGRMRDLMIIPAAPSYDHWHAESVIFGTGKPTLILPERALAETFKLNTVMVAWDFSRTAARAIADAIGILEKAKDVRVVTVQNEKEIDTKRSSEEVAKNLSRHGITVTLEDVDAAGRSIGEVLKASAASCDADLLVMGAYGHSRFREFILGGATQSLLSDPPLPIMFSH
ncbi:Nucleotide-binding universal stress protein, UspA family [Tardiphaga sp. OK246]|jgi:nucleotide-binding universal stress UspA family protein|uniref:universal stress protein n=1 Tax=Tardiphaga sp. OK246 TaxID=1855307 RepID=UPI000B628630|nr:universal stress protein [Tardiphaga sp. OK246]SNT43119.1 Nucleotide-binding universal stress protein, UspA family [Tardiphaga sp. OK246]